MKCYLYGSHLLILGVILSNVILHRLPMVLVRVNTSKYFS